MSKPTTVAEASFNPRPVEAPRELVLKVVVPAGEVEAFKADIAKFFDSSPFWRSPAYAAMVRTLRSAVLGGFK